MDSYTEDTLVEQPAIALFAELGWATVAARGERFGSSGTLGRETSQEVILVPRLRTALRRLNPKLPAAAISAAIEEITKDRSAKAPAAANQEVYALLKDGVKLRLRGKDGEEADEMVRVIDWRNPATNDFLLASQVTVLGEVHSRRPDLIGFVNGLPLVLVELKAVHHRLEEAYERNIVDYKRTIPRLFWGNALILVSNGLDAKVGSATAGWEHFGEWKRLEHEDEPARPGLETAIRGTCDPVRLLDLIENFTLFTTARGGLVKLVAKNHQYLGVNNAFAALRRGQGGADSGRLGVFWHTQGSGKSYSMVFFAQKVLRTLPGNWTFLIVTDRQELDDQIHGTFQDAGAVTEKKVQAANGEDLKRLLREDHRLVFTLIQKFRTAAGAAYPVLSERTNVIVMTDEAHRSQYDLFALNMRRALPGAAFIGFTGTPLLAGEERTREVFGDYVSVYNFRQSVEDGATVPLYYENRIPELELTNLGLNADMEELIARAALDEDQESRLAWEFSREYQLITREERLTAIAADIVRHFLGRGWPGKAMVVSLDKATAVRMYDKVQATWQAELARLRAEPDGDDIRQRIAFMERTDMAVVVSESPGEDEAFAARGLDIATHRRRLRTELLADKFKDAADPLRIVIVCAMWLTGFDAPSVSTIYLDKPMRNHTLMQTIARANRVVPGKPNGIIVDYVGVFRNLQQALAIYGSATGGGVASGDSPVAPKQVLVDQLRAKIAATRELLAERGIAPDAILTASGWERQRLLFDAREALLVDDATKRRYLAQANEVARNFQAILPDPAAQEFSPLKVLFDRIAQMIRAIAPTVRIGGVLADVEELLDASVAAEGYLIREEVESNLIDLSQLDFAALGEAFATGRQHTESERLRSAITRTLDRLVALNRTRADYLARFQHLIEEYNAGSKNIQLHFAELVEFAQRLNDEERRGVREHLAEDELAVFDLLTRPGPELTAKEVEQVKGVARQLLAGLKQGKLVLDWRQKQRERAGVRVVIAQLLRGDLPDPYSAAARVEKTEIIYQHVYDSYHGRGASIYGTDQDREGAYRVG